ncbi:MAG: hydrogenase iron-sulfur subunit [bacterium]
MVNIKGHAEFEPDVVVLYCQHCLAQNEEAKKKPGSVSGFNPRLLMMPCSSKVEISHVLKILSEGADAVQVVGCKTDNCRFLVGSLMAEKRIEHTRRLLDESLMGADRLGMKRGENLTFNELLSFAEERAKAVKALGPNPMKRLLKNDYCGMETYSGNL